MKILLIDAGEPRDSLAWNAWTTEDGQFAAPSVGLVSLASLVPEKDSVRIVDEKIGESVDVAGVDVAGISFKTMYADRAYALADSLRAKGVRVVLGGLHASLCPEEAGEHADAVLAGEGEGLWPTILQDLEDGKVSRIYRAPFPCLPIKDLPKQRVELVPHERYFFHAVQTARGCSLDCEFCPTRAMFGAGFRLRSLYAVAEEVQTLVRLREKPVFFTDDVFGAGNGEFIGLLTERLKTMNMSYAVICDLAMLTPEIVRQLAMSGCRIMTINMPGTCTSKEEAALRNIRATGIRVWGYFMFGFEFHRADVFERVVGFVRRTGMEHVSLTILSPYPGTPMGERLRKENRILSEDRRLYDQSHVVFRPAGMSAEQLEEGFALVVREIGDLCGLRRIGEGFSLPPARSTQPTGGAE